MQTTTRSAGQAAARKSNGNGPKSGGKKKKTQPKSNGKEGPAGPRPVAPPPVSGPWGNPKPAASSAPPPGFAPSPPHSTNVGFSDAHQRLLRHRALFVFRYLVGKAVELQLVASEERYAGILDCVDPDDFSVVLKSAKRLSSGADAKPFEDGSTVIFRRHQLAHLVADGTVNYTDGVFTSGASAAGGFRTDTEISGQKGEHLYGRELETASSWLDPALDTGALEDSGSNGRRHSKNQGKAGWNQFEANEKLFGVVSTYDENIYTTKLDKSKISTEQSRAAEKLAQEIERQSAAGNFHLQEERGQTVRGGKHANDLDEEARYSSVDRRPPPSGANAYVPPAMRNAQRQSSGGKSQVTATNPTPADIAAVPAPPVSLPTTAGATAAPPAAPTTPKPLSFSEAVTGRSATTAKPAVAPKEVPKSQPDEKKEASSSPKRAALPTQVNGKDIKAAATKAKGSPKKKDAANEKEKKSDSKAVSKTESKSSSSTTTTTTTTAPKQLKEESSKAAPTKGLNPNAKEFKLNASAAEFTPSFAMSPAVKEQVSSPYRGGSPGHMPYPHPGMGYPPPMQEEWMYDGGMGGEVSGEMGMPPYGYGMPMGPNGVPMMYPPMMPQQNMLVQVCLVV
ncbi:Hypothetical protein PHPALM_37232 [Phytophthora palmivora]|uniref:LsmAD domain-containing protein n=1 Tax=Phytophthora palmivora TaxID=4796 RepID=A0A2P4WXX6_9STRA|nr:Hypothetical protein PHPALM_37232 [Phytophthora palmivora]